MTISVVSRARVLGILQSGCNNIQRAKHTDMHIHVHIQIRTCPIEHLHTYIHVRTYSFFIFSCFHFFHFFILFFFFSTAMRFRVAGMASGFLFSQPPHQLSAWSYRYIPVYKIYKNRVFRLKGGVFSRKNVCKLTFLLGRSFSFKVPAVRRVVKKCLFLE